nr:YjfB family protein [Lachnospiraceae bacterium]
MDIAALAMNMSQTKIMQSVGTAVLSKAMDTNEQMGNQIAQMIDSSAMELSVNPNVGAN